MTNPTSNFGWQMPTPTDLVTDLPADFEVFGQAVDSSMADLKGGTTGQILSKATNTDMDFTWITNDIGDITAVTAGTGISGGGTSGDVTITNSMATAIDAKGDLIAGTADNAFSRLATGTTGQILSVDGTTTTGLKWVTPNPGDITAVNVTAPITGGGSSGDVTISIQDASTSQKGAVQLSDSTSTTSSVLAASSTAVKSAYDLASLGIPSTRTISTTAPLTGGGDLSANRTFGITTATTSATGAVQLSDSVSTTSSVLAATPTAVKTTYDTAVRATPPFSYIAGRFYKPPFQVTTTTSVISAGLTYYTPFYVRETYTFTKIQIATGGTFSGTSSIRLGIYNSTNGVPSTLVLDAGTISATAATTAYNATISQTLNPGWYWLAENTITAATVNNLSSISAPNFTLPDLGSATIFGLTNIGYTQTVNATSGFANAVSPVVGTLAVNLGLGA